MGEPVACPRKRGYLVTLKKEKPVVPRLQLATFLWVSRLSEKTLTKLFSIHCGLPLEMKNYHDIQESVYELLDHCSSQCGILQIKD